MYFRSIHLPLFHRLRLDLKNKGEGNGNPVGVAKLEERKKPPKVCNLACCLDYGLRTTKHHFSIKYQMKSEKIMFLEIINQNINKLYPFIAHNDYYFVVPFLRCLDI